MKPIYIANYNFYRSLSCVKSFDLIKVHLSLAVEIERDEKQQPVPEYAIFVRVRQPYISHQMRIEFQRKKLRDK